MAIASTACRPVFAWSPPHRRACRSRRWPTRRGASTACSSIRKSPTPCRGGAMLRRFVRRHLRLRDAVDRRPTSSKTRSRACASRSARDEVLLGLSGGVDSSVVAALLHKAIGDAADLRVRRHRPAALDEGDQVMADVRRAHGRERDPRQRAERFSRELAGRRRSGSQAQDHRPAVHRGLRGRSAQARGPSGWRRARSTRT
jgi:hypothetical protein